MKQTEIQLHHGMWGPPWHWSLHHYVSNTVRDTYAHKVQMEVGFRMQEDEQPLMCYPCGVWMYPLQRWLKCLRGGHSVAECGFTWSAVTLDPTILTYWTIARSIQWSKGPKASCKPRLQNRGLSHSGLTDIVSLVLHRHTNTTIEVGL